MFGALIVLLSVQALAACGSAASGTPAPISSIPVTPSAASPPIGATLPASSAEAGTFAVFCDAIHVRIQAPPRLMQSEGACQGNNLFLTPNISATEVEFLTIFRYAGDPRGQDAAGWSDVLEGFHRTDTASGDTAWSADGQPTPQAARGYAGFLGRFARTDKGGVQYAGALWTGQAGADTVAILFQGAAAQRATLDADMAQVLRTIDLDAR
jgi:hypothetical protein